MSASVSVAMGRSATHRGKIGAGRARIVWKAGMKSRQDLHLSPAARRPSAKAYGSSTAITNATAICRSIFSAAGAAFGETASREHRLAKATAGTIRLKLLKLGALVTVSVRRIKIAIASACPMKGVFANAHRRLCSAA